MALPGVAVPVATICVGSVDAIPEEPAVAAAFPRPAEPLGTPPFVALATPTSTNATTSKMRTSRLDGDRRRTAGTFPMQVEC